jgi:hypothetical protein
VEVSPQAYYLHCELRSSAVFKRGFVVTAENEVEPTLE